MNVAAGGHVEVALMLIVRGANIDRKDNVSNRTYIYVCLSASVCLSVCLFANTYVCVCVIYVYIYVYMYGCLCMCVLA